MLVTFCPGVTDPIVVWASARGQVMWPRVSFAIYPLSLAVSCGDRWAGTPGRSTGRLRDRLAVVARNRTFSGSHFLPKTFHMACVRAEGLLFQGFQTKKENVLFLGPQTDSKQRTLYSKVLNKDSIKHISLNLAFNQTSRACPALSIKSKVSFIVTVICLPWVHLEPPKMRGLHILGVCMCGHGHVCYR